MKNIVVILLLTVFVFSLSACLDEKDEYNVGNFTCNSLSKVTNEKQNCYSKGVGVGGGKRYSYSFFSFKNNDKRDSAAEQYVSYLIDSFDFSELSQSYTYSVYSDMDKNIFVQYGCDTENETINIGVDTSEDNKLKLLIIVISDKN